jgi:hypothetical protein
MVNHECNKCGRIFNKKSTYINHVENKKKPCIPILINIEKNILKNPQINEDILKNPQSIIISLESDTDNKNDLEISEKKKVNRKNINIQEYIVKDDEIEQENEKEDELKKCDNYKCNYCDYTSIRIDNFKRHLINCKIRKEENREKEEIYQKLLKNYEVLQEQNKALIKRLENNDEMLKNLGNKKSKSSKNVQNNNGTINNQNNGTINNTIIIQHGKEDLTKIENDVFLNSFLKYSGAKIPEKIVEGIHFNDKHPEYQNIYISDINREKIMTHNGIEWLLAPSDNVTSDLLDKSIIYSENKYEELEPRIKEIAKKKITKELKIMELMKEFDELEEKGIDADSDDDTPISKKEIERRKYLRAKAEEYIKLLLYNNRHNK